MAVRIPQRQGLSLPVFFAFLLLIPALNGCLCYLAQAGSGQMRILWNRQPIEKVLSGKGTEKETRRKLRLVLDVRSFAAENLRLNPGSSFTTYSDINRKHVAWVVTAAPELSLDPITWWFPIVGRVPYLGYFSIEDAREKAAELKKKGMDTLLRPVPAYSTLGWFDDPLLSSQLAYSENYLIRIVIHEAVHSTIWFEDDVDFNESLASFIEEKGTMAYYRRREGPAGQSARHLRQLFLEQKKLNQIFHGFTIRLDDLYRGPLSDGEKRKQKKILISELRRQLKTRAGAFREINLEKLAALPFNNAHFLSYKRYFSGSEAFARLYRESGGNWKIFIERLKKLQDLSEKERRKKLQTF